MIEMNIRRVLAVTTVFSLVLVVQAFVADIEPFGAEFGLAQKPGQRGQKNHEGKQRQQSDEGKMTGHHEAAVGQESCPGTDNQGPGIGHRGAHSLGHWLSRGRPCGERRRHGPRATPRPG